MRAGAIVFPISPRNSPAAIAHLLPKTSVTHILVGREQGLKDLLKASLNLLDKNLIASTAISEVPSFEDIYIFGKEENAEFYNMPFKKPDINDTGIILHSSGLMAHCIAKHSYACLLTSFSSRLYCVPKAYQADALRHSSNVFDTFLRRTRLDGSANKSPLRSNVSWPRRHSNDVCGKFLH